METRPTTSSLMEWASCDFEYLQLDRGGAARPRGDADDAIEPGVARVAGLEPRRRAHVVERRLDRLARGEAADDLRRAVPHAPVRHVDERAVVRLDRIARV